MPSAFKSYLSTNRLPQALDGTYLFACHLAWQQEGALWGYEELVRALDAPDEEVRSIAEALLQRRSPRPLSAHHIAVRRSA